MHRSIIVPMALPAILLCLTAAAEDKPRDENGAKTFMRAKLDAAGDALEGLTSEDFDQIRSGARQLQLMSQRAAWKVLKTPDYLQYSGEFRKAAEQMEEAAAEKNLDKAALAYVQLTLTCVNCHKHVRRNPVTQLLDRRLLPVAAFESDPGDFTSVADVPEGKHEDQEKDRRPLSRFMRVKLTAARDALEGLTREDFKLVEKGALKLHQMSAAEEWRISNDAIYRQHSRQFQRVTERLAARASAKELDGASLAWVETTMSCIECHKWARANLVAD